MTHSVKPVSPFRTMVWREMREHAGAALFAFIGVSLFFLISAGLGSTFSHAAAGAGGTAVSLNPAGSSSFGFFTLTSAIAGLFLGRAVMLGDRWGDERAFLVHRPVSATEIFFAKARAATLLYVLAAGIPLALRTWWNAAPGSHPIPYDLRLALPDVADFSTGLVYVAGGMLLALRRRSVDRGLLALGGPIMCTVLVVAATEFWQAELVVLVSLVVVGIAAHETFTSIADYEGKSRPARTSLAAIVGLGWMFAGTIAAGIASFSVISTAASSSTTTSTVLASNGQLVRTTTRFDAARARSGRSPWSIIAVTDLAGRPVPAFHDTTSFDTLARGVASTRRIPLVLDQANQPSSVFSDRGYRGTDRVYVPIYAAVDPSDPMLWYFVRARGLIAGYDLRTSRLAGWFGPDGYHAGTKPPANTFHGDLRLGSEFLAYAFQLLPFSSDVYRVDLVRREVRRIFSASPGETVTGAATSGDSVELFTPRSSAFRDTTPRFDVIATTRAVYVRSRGGDSLLTFANDPSVAGYGTVSVARAPNAPGGPTVFRYDPGDGTLDRAAARAASARAFVVTNQSPATPERVALPSDAYQGGGMQRLDWTEPVTAFVTPLAALVMDRLKSVANGNGLGRFGLMSLLTLLGALVACVVTVVVGRAYAFSNRRTALWGVGAFAFGVVSVLTMLVLVTRPARETCPKCGRKRVVTRESCEHCGAPFEKPAPDGTEIFEPFSASAVSS